MAINVVEILVKAKDMTKEGFAEADASTSALGEKLSKIGMIAGAGLAAVGYEAAKMAIGFNAQMTMLNTQAGVSKSKLAQLQSGVLALAGQVGFSPDSLAESLYHVASNMESMGATSARELAVVKVAAEGAKTGGADLVDVTNALTAAVASGIPGVQNYNQAMGMLNATVGSGDMKMQDLAEAFGSGMVATVKGFGLSLKDVGAALAVFGDNNIRGAHAGTQLRMSVMALAAPVKTGIANLQSMGIGANQLAKDMESGGLLKALTDLITHMRAAGISAKEQGQIITNDFGKKAGAGLNVLLDQMDRLRSKYPAITAGANKFGQAWKTTQGTVKQQLSQLSAGFDALMISIGEKLLPVIQAMVGWMLKNKTVVTDVLMGVGALAAALALYAIGAKTAAMVTGLWEAAQVGIRLALGMTAGELNALTVAQQLQALASKVGAAAQWLFNAAMDANPIMLVVVAIGALVAGVVYAYTHFTAFRHVVQDVFGWIKAHWPLLLAIITGPIGLAVLFIVDHWKQVVRIFDDVIGWVKEHWPLLLAILTGPIGLAYYYIAQHFDQIRHWIASTFDRIRHDIATWGDDVLNWFKSLPVRIVSALGDLGHLLRNAGKSILEGLLGGLKSAWNDVSGWVSHVGGWIANLKGPIDKDATLLVPHGKAIMGGLLVGLKSRMPDLEAQLAATSAAITNGVRLPGAGAYGGLGGYGPGTGGQRVIVEFHGGGGAELDQAVWQWLVRNVRVKGGGGPNSAQIAFGQTH